MQGTTAGGRCEPVLAAELDGLLDERLVQEDPFQAATGVVYLLRGGSRCVLRRFDGQGQPSHVEYVSQH
ncbi:hypothetical protein BDZ89DRAFT_1084016 [Hymenopellis radicata]|nr:hypothetical protein BDZ89DRAFT_1084016 [Hymenopellis radicata]